MSPEIDTNPHGIRWWDVLILLVCQALVAAPWLLVVEMEKSIGLGAFGGATVYGFIRERIATGSIRNKDGLNFTILSLLNSGVFVVLFFLACLVRILFTRDGKDIYDQYVVEEGYSIPVMVLMFTIPVVGLALMYSMVCWLGLIGAHRWLRLWRGK